MEEWEEAWVEAWEVGWEWEVVTWEGVWAEAWEGVWAVEWEEGEDGMAAECGKGAWTGEWEEEWEVDKGQEEEAGLVSKATLVASKEDSGQEEATQVLLSGEVVSSREEAEVSPEVEEGDFNQAPYFSEKCTFMVTSWLKPEIYV